MNCLQGDSAIWFLYIAYKHILLSVPAERVTNNLKELAQQVTPGDIVSTYGIRKAMGISVPLPETEDSWVDLTDGEYMKTSCSICSAGTKLHLQILRLAYGGTCSSMVPVFSSSLFISSFSNGKLLPLVSIQYESFVCMEL